MTVGKGFSTVVQCAILSARNRRTQKNGADRDRTDDLNVANVALSQLSYCPYLKPMIIRRDLPVK